MTISFAPASPSGLLTPAATAQPGAQGADRAHPGLPHAIVIGSGFGGLAAAVRLSCKGYRVTVLEKLGGFGGRAGVWRQDGFTFDAGPTIVTAPFMLEELWSLCGRRFADDVKLVPTNPFYRIRYDDGTHFDYGNDAQANREQIRRISPADLPGYERFVTEAEMCYRLGFEKLGAIAYDSPGDLVRAVPKLIRMRGWRSPVSYTHLPASSGACSPRKARGRVDHCRRHR